MDPITPPAAESTPDNRLVRTDLRLAAVLLAVVIGGNMIWHSSDAGILTVLGR